MRFPQMLVRTSSVALSLLLCAGAAGARNETAKLTASDGAENDYCGYSVAVFGTLALTGAPHHSVLEGWSGAAYLHNVITGQELAKLVPSGGVLGELFGTSVQSISAEQPGLPIARFTFSLVEQL